MTEKERQIAKRRGGRGGRGAESYDHKKACFSIYHSYSLTCYRDLDDIQEVHGMQRQRIQDMSFFNFQLVLTAVMYSVTNTQHNLYYTSCKRLRYTFWGLHFYTFLAFQKDPKRRMIAIGKISIYFLKNLPFFEHIQSKFLKKCYNDSNNFPPHHLYGISENAEFYADSKFVELGAKIILRKSYRPKTM